MVMYCTSYVSDVASTATGAAPSGITRAPVASFPKISTSPANTVASLLAGLIPLIPAEAPEFTL